VNDNNNKHVWVGIGKQVLSFVIGGIAVAFFLGGREAKINTLAADTENWKRQWPEEKSRIERMDSQGTLSFKFFREDYEKTQAQQFQQIKDLESEVKHMENLRMRIEQLEKKQ
jgi:hypothetical protein